jgi:hypothetical protein
MNSIGRLFLALAALGWWTTVMATVDWQANFGPQADLWKVPAYFAQMQPLRNQGEAFEAQVALLNRLHGARCEILAGLREQRLTAAEAVDRFSELEAQRINSGLPAPGWLKARPLHAIACTQLLGWLRQERTERKAMPGDDVLARVEAELRDRVK